MVLLLGTKVFLLTVRLLGAKVFLLTVRLLGAKVFLFTVLLLGALASMLIPLLLVLVVRLVGDFRPMVLRTFMGIRIRSRRVIVLPQVLSKVPFFYLVGLGHAGALPVLDIPLVAWPKH
jgi:hypothetical protein